MSFTSYAPGLLAIMDKSVKLLVFQLLFCVHYFVLLLSVFQRYFCQYKKEDGTGGNVCTHPPTHTDTHTQMPAIRLI